MPWDEHAACNGHDGDLWFPDIPRGPKPDNTPDPWANARTICNTCPVKDDCLEHALSNDERHGMWGGTTPEERRRILNGPRPRSCRWCGGRFTAPGTRAVYCSPACRTAGELDRHRARTAKFRNARRLDGRCVDCGYSSVTHRCEHCQRARRGAA